LLAKEISRQPDGKETSTDVPKELKKQLIVLVTPTLIDEAGNRVHTNETKPIENDRLIR
jgi:hypothetical protein